MRLIDLDKLMEFPIRLDHCDTEHGDMTFVYGIESVLEYAEYLPIIDAVPVIRCMDCKHRTHNGTCIRMMKKKSDDGYCDEGEKKQVWHDHVI